MQRGGKKGVEPVQKNVFEFIKELSHDNRMYVVAEKNCEYGSWMIPV